jgi:hypothetical protein
LELGRFRRLKGEGIVDNWMTLRRWVANEGFPAPIALGPNSVAFDMAAVYAWVASRPRRIPKVSQRPKPKLEASEEAKQNSEKTKSGS